MRALIQRSLRGPSDLIVSGNHQLPVPGPGEYLLRVVAAGVNFADVMQTRGVYEGGPVAPYVAGFEAVGEIVAVGPDVPDPLPLGTHVVGTGRGAFAQYMSMPATTALSIPPGWRAAEALGIVLNVATALAALRPLGGLEQGELVLIHAGAGGVGQEAIRLARHYGARVVATASPAKHEAVRALGADLVLDSTGPDLTERILAFDGEVDLVLESVGRSTFETSLAVTKRFTGRIVVFGAASGDASLTTRDLIFSRQVQVKGLHIGAMSTTVPDLYRSLLAEIGALIDEGVVRPGTPVIHPLAEGSALLRRLEQRRTSGKHALDPWR